MSGVNEKLPGRGSPCVPPECCPQPAPAGGLKSPRWARSATELGDRCPPSTSEQLVTVSTESLYGCHWRQPIKTCSASRPSILPKLKRWAWAKQTSTYFAIMALSRNWAFDGSGVLVVGNRARLQSPLRLAEHAKKENGRHVGAVDARLREPCRFVNSWFHVGRRIDWSLAVGSQGSPLTYRSPRRRCRRRRHRSSPTDRTPR